jgi:N4-(beta-N-acetylglucosaminyl)-L-asparaginase
MHGPKKRAGGVAVLEGVRTPSLVARAVADYTDHHLLVGKGAQDFARNMGFEIEDDLNTERSRELWLEWRRRIDPEHYLDPDERTIRRRGGAVAGGSPQTAPGLMPAVADPLGLRDRYRRHYQAGLSMVRDGLIPEHSFWGTINCNGINAGGDICGVTTTSGLSWKIPGRAGDSPILGAGLYVDGDVGACGSTGRGEANLFNLSSFLVVEKMREGMHPKDATLAALQRIRDNTIEERLLNSRGEPAFNVRFFALDKQGRHAGVQMYGGGEGYAICSENGAELLPFDYLLEGAPDD